jgi:hypothetical protein
MFNQIASSLIKNPKQLFMIDGIGALVSATLLGIFLPQFESIFGIPISALYWLAIFPCLFAFYDFYCYFWIKTKVTKYLTGLAAINVMYCVLSIIVAYYHHNSITTFGWLYILMEITVVLLLANLEYSTAKKMR